MSFIEFVGMLTLIVALIVALFTFLVSVVIMVITPRGFYPEVTQEEPPKHGEFRPSPYLHVRTLIDLGRSLGLGLEGTVCLVSVAQSEVTRFGITGFADHWRKFVLDGPHSPFKLVTAVGLDEEGLLDYLIFCGHVLEVDPTKKEFTGKVWEILRVLQDRHDYAVDVIVNDEKVVERCSVEHAHYLVKILDDKSDIVRLNIFHKLYGHYEDWDVRVQ